MAEAVFVQAITVPAGSTVGYALGVNTEGREVAFAGDHRPLRDLGVALGVSDEPLLASVEDWQFVSVDLFYQQRSLSQQASRLHRVAAEPSL